MNTKILPARNVFGQPLVPCSFDPVTGFFRDGCCKTNEEDVGTHVICAIMTKDFLEFSKSRGNDLSTPHPEWQFRGLKPGDQWCLCARRWVEAMHADAAPLVILESCNEHALQFADIDTLSRFAYRGQPDD
jgi:uncharacterized protein (DUF2237 family)